MSELRQAVLNAEDIESELVDVPQWGVKLEVRGMTGKERAAFLRIVSKRGGGEVDLEKFYPALVVATAYDPETGDKVFEPADREALNNKSGAALDTLAKVALRLSGLGADAIEEAVEDLDDSQRSGST